MKEIIETMPRIELALIIIGVLFPRTSRETEPQYHHALVGDGMWSELREFYEGEMQAIAIPVRIAMVKLEKVPINTYSVVRISWALFNSPKRKTDFAASKKPTPSKLPTRTNVRIMILSI